MRRNGKAAQRSDAKDGKVSRVSRDKVVCVACGGVRVRGFRYYCVGFGVCDACYECLEGKEPAGKVLSCYKCRREHAKAA